MLWTPIHDAASAIEEAIVGEFLKCSVYGADDALVEREELPRPVARSAKLPELAFHERFVFERERQNFFVELFGLHIEPRSPLFLELFFVHDLGLKACMVGTGEPQRFFATHPLVADHNVFERDEKRMARMQGTVGIWWRHNDS